MNSPLATYTWLTPYRLLTLAAPTVVTASQVLPETVVGQSADQESPATVWSATTEVPVAITASTSAEIDGVARNFTSQLAV